MDEVSGWVFQRDELASPRALKWQYLRTAFYLLNCCFQIRSGGYFIRRAAKRGYGVWGLPREVDEWLGAVAAEKYLRRGLGRYSEAEVEEEGACKGEVGVVVDYEGGAEEGDAWACWGGEG